MSNEKYFSFLFSNYGADYRPLKSRSVLTYSDQIIRNSENHIKKRGKSTSEVLAEIDKWHEKSKKSPGKLDNSLVGSYVK